MKKSVIKILAIESVFLVFSLLNILVIKITNLYIMSSILLLFTAIAIFLLGYEKSQKRFGKDIILNFIIYTIIFQILINLLGLIFGYLNNGYSMNFVNIIKNILPIILVIITSEFLRYCINIKGQNNKITIILSVIIFIMLDISLQSHLFNFNDKKDVVELICTIIFQSISKNILLTYSSIKFGYQGNIIYRLIMELPIYILPIIPNINIYLESIIQFIFPIIILYIISKNFEKNKIQELDIRKSSFKSKILAMLLIIICTMTISLTSGIFSIYALSIGSESMVPNIHKGDVVIVKKIKQKDIEILKEKDILVFNYNKKVIVHRIVEKSMKDNKYYFKTKGDNNNNIDDWIIEENDVIGIAKFKIRFIGYPTVWLNEYLN